MYQEVNTVYMSVDSLCECR